MAEAFGEDGGSHGWFEIVTCAWWLLIDVNLVARLWTMESEAVYSTSRFFVFCSQGAVS